MVALSRGLALRAVLPGAKGGMPVWGCAFGCGLVGSKVTPEGHVGKAHHASTFLSRYGKSDTGTCYAQRVKSDTAQGDTGRADEGPDEGPGTGAAHRTGAPEALTGSGGVAS